jgi:hypothetical protein
MKSVDAAVTNAVVENDRNTNGVVVVATTRRNALVEETNGDVRNVVAIAIGTMKTKSVEDDVKIVGSVKRRELPDVPLTIRVATIQSLLIVRSVIGDARNAGDSASENMMTIDQCDRIAAKREMLTAVNVAHEIPKEID